LPIHLLIPGLRRLAVLAALAPAAVAADLPDGLYAEFSTPKGSIVCELEYARAPLTVTNFVGLAEGTLGPSPRKPFFDGLTFHRVVPNFVIQGGDPLGTGEGGPGYMFPDEFSPRLGHGSIGILSMANAGPDTNGSQFFITLAPADSLDFLHSVFGRTVRGADVLQRIAQGDPMRVRILRIGAPARAFRANDASFAALAARVPRFPGPGEPGPRAFFDDPDKLLPADPPRAQNFNIKLANLERSTGLKIYARIFAKFTPSAAGGSPRAFARTLAQSLGVEKNGILAVYFRERDAWVLNVGESLAPRFTNVTGIRRTDGEPDPLEASIGRFLEESRLRETLYLERSARILPNFLQIPGQRVKVSVDAILDGLIAKITS